MRLDVSKVEGYQFEGRTYLSKSELAFAILISHLLLWVKGRYPTLPPAIQVSLADNIADSLSYFREIEAEIRHEVHLIVEGKGE